MNELLICKMESVQMDFVALAFLSSIFSVILKMKMPVF